MGYLNIRQALLIVTHPFIQQDFFEGVVLASGVIMLRLAVTIQFTGHGLASACTRGVWTKGLVMELVCPQIL